MTPRETLIRKRYSGAPESFLKWFIRSGLSPRNLNAARQAWAGAMDRAIDLTQDHPQSAGIHWAIRAET